MIGKRSFGSKVFDVVNAGITLAAVVMTLYPLLFVLFASLSSPKAFMAHSGFLWRPAGELTLKGYELTLKNPNIINGFKNTLFYVLAGTGINLVLTSIGAFVLTRRHFALARLGSILIVVTMFFSGGIIPLFFVVRGLGLYDSRWAVILPVAISAYNMIIMQSFFRGIPDSLEESAALDGANDFQVFLRIIIPLSKPVLAVMVLYYGVGHWNAYFSAMIYLRNRKLYPLQLFLREILLRDTVESMATSSVEIAEESLFRYLIKYCAIMVTTVPVLCVYPFLQRFFVKGVMVGAIKG